MEVVQLRQEIYALAIKLNLPDVIADINALSLDELLRLKVRLMALLE